MLASSVFRARTRLALGGGGHRLAIEDRLASLRRRWNQFGLQALVDAGEDGAGIVVHYRLTVADHPDPDEVHAAFRDDLDRALGSAGQAASEPATWSLEEMARATDASPTPVALRYEADTEYRWEA